MMLAMQSKQTPDTATHHPLGHQLPTCTCHPRPASPPPASERRDVPTDNSKKASLRADNALHPHPEAVRDESFLQEGKPEKAMRPIRLRRPPGRIIGVNSVVRFVKGDVCKPQRHDRRPVVVDYPDAGRARIPDLIPGSGLHRGGDGAVVFGHRVVGGMHRQRRRPGAGAERHTPRRPAHGRMPCRRRACSRGPRSRWRSPRCRAPARHPLPLATSASPRSHRPGASRSAAPRPAAGRRRRSP